VMRYSGLYNAGDAAMSITLILRQSLVAVSHRYNVPSIDDQYVQ